MRNVLNPSLIFFYNSSWLLHLENLLSRGFVPDLGHKLYGKSRAWVKYKEYERVEM